MKVSEVNSSKNTNFCAKFSKADINKLIYSAKTAYGWENPSAIPKLHAMLSHIDTLPFEKVFLEEYSHLIKSWSGNAINTTRYQISSESGEILGRGVNPYFALLNSTVKTTDGEEAKIKRMIKSVFTRKWRKSKNINEDEIKKFAINA